MASSDDEQQIMEDHALKEWAKDAPDEFSHDERPTRTQQALKDREIKDWLSKKPKRRNPYK